MWNKLFRKRSKSVANKTDTQSNASEHRPATTKCFSFGRKFEENKSTYTLSSDNFQYLQYESQAYAKPGEKSLFLLGLVLEYCVDWFSVNFRLLKHLDGFEDDNLTIDF
jgi:hypothetical protein